MTPSKDLAFVSDDELLADHHETFSQVKLRMNDEDDDEDEEPELTSNFNHHVDSAEEAVEHGTGASKVNGKITSGLLRTSYKDSLDDLPRISITPMTPGSISPELDDGHSTISLNSSGGSPLFQNQKYHGRMSMCPNLYWRPQSPMPPKSDSEAKEFFAYRDSIVAHVLEEVVTLVDETDGTLHGTWLLTEIDHWDNEKERILLLCEKSIIIVKYDFIAMRKEDYRRIYLTVIDKIVQGELKYPERSLAPRLSGIAGGLVGVMKDCIIPKVQGTVSTVGSVVMPKKCPATKETVVEEGEDGGPPSDDGQGDNIRSPKTSLMSALALENFEPRTRNVQGIRIMWNQDLPLSFTQKWNPFNKSIPWMTFASHPLLWHKGGGGTNRSFDIESFSRELIEVLSHGGVESSPMYACRVEYKPIIIETYLGLASLFHNANALGFYKVRGKVSF